MVDLYWLEVFSTTWRAWTTDELTLGCAQKHKARNSAHTFVIDASRGICRTITILTIFIALDQFCQSEGRRITGIGSEVVRGWIHKYNENMYMREWPSNIEGPLGRRARRIAIPSFMITLRM